MSEADPLHYARQRAAARSVSDNGVLTSSRRSARHAASPEGVTHVADVALLQALLVTPLQRVEDLALMTGISLRTAYRHLDHLHAQGFVDTVVPGNLGRASCRIVYLTRAGIRLLAGGDPVAARRLARIWGADMRGLARLLPRLPARIALQQALPSLLMACQHSAASNSGQRREHRVSASVSGAALLRWRWTLAYRQVFTYRSRPRRLSVDAVLAVHVTVPVGRSGKRAPAGEEQGSPRDDIAYAGDTWYAVWVLLDAGVGNTRALVPRLSAVVAYRESSIRWPLYTQFPPILILTASMHRAAMWQQAAREATLQLRADPLVGMIQIAPPGAVSCWPLSVPGIPFPQSLPDPTPACIELVSGVPTTLTSLFTTALPEVALPPGLSALPLAPLVLGETSVALAVSANSAADGTGPLPARVPRVHTVFGSRKRGRVRGSKGRPTVQRSDELTQRLEHARKRGLTAVLDSDQRTMLRASLALTLTRREETVLDALARHPLVCQDDLAAWLAIAPDWIGRLRRQLRRAGLVQAFRVPQSSLLPLRCAPVPAASGVASQQVACGVPSRAETTYLLRLTPLGWNFLAAVYHLPARQLAGGAPHARASLIASGASAVLARPLALPRLPGKALHQASVYRVFTLLLQDMAIHAQKRGERQEQLLWWETGVACVRRYRSMGRWGTLRPDGAGEFQCGGRRVRFWLEWDSGSMGLNLLREKLERYATYAQTTTWRMEDTRFLPVLLIVTPDLAQERRIMRLVDELRQRARLQWPGPLLIRTTTASRLTREGPLASIWLPVLPPGLPEMHADCDEAKPLQSTPGTSVRLMGPLERVPPASHRLAPPYSAQPSHAR